MADDRAGKDVATPRSLIWRIEHVIALLVAIVAAIFVFQYTGESEFFLAIGSGMGLGVVAWVLGWLHFNSKWTALWGGQK